MQIIRFGLDFWFGCLVGFGAFGVIQLWRWSRRKMLALTRPQVVRVPTKESPFQVFMVGSVGCLAVVAVIVLLALAIRQFPWGP
jgi:hypothetical protein